MATISELLHKIRTAVYGKEVRSAIADSIEKCYQDAQTGAVSIPDGSITADKLADGAVTNDKIAAGAVSNGKLADNAAVIEVLYDGAVVQDIQGRSNFADISTVVETAIDDSSTTKDKYPPTIGAVKTYLRNNASGSMSRSENGTSRITLNGVSNYFPTLDGSTVSGGVVNPDKLPLATSSTKGAMSAADKEKLDSIDVSKLDNVSSISIESISGAGGSDYSVNLTIDGELYRLPLLNPAKKMTWGNLPTESDLVNFQNSSNPASVGAVKNYVSGTEVYNHGERKLRISIGGVDYEVPLILTTGKTASGLIGTTDTITSAGTYPVNGKAVYDYIESLNIGAPTDAQVDSAVTEWMEDNISYYVNHGVDYDSVAGYIELHTAPDDPTTDVVLFAPLLETANSKIASKYIPVDNTLTQNGIPADAKTVGDRLTNVFSNDVKQALLAMFRKCLFLDGGDEAYDALESALYPPANLLYITAVYTQSGTVYEGDSLDDLKSDLVVTANYDNGTSETVSTYALSGTLAEGTSTITVTYGGKTTTFNVIVTAWDYEWTYTDGTLTDNGWVLAASGGTTTMESDGLLLTSNTTGSNTLNYTNATYVGVNTIAEYEFKPITIGSVSGSSSVIFGITDDGTKGAKQIIYNDNKLYMVEGSTNVVIPNVTLTLNEWHKVRIEYLSSGVTVFFDDTQVYSSTAVATSYISKTNIAVVRGASMKLSAVRFKRVS